MKTALGVLTIVFVVLALAVTAILISVNYQIDRDINGWKSRAQVSSEPNDMLEYMTKVKTGMESWGMTSGSAALIWQTSDNDMALIYKTVQRHVDQAAVLTKMDRSTPEYQTGLDNLRGSIRELNLYAWAYYSVHQGLVLSIFCWMFWIAFCVFGIWWFIVSMNG